MRQLERLLVCRASFQHVAHRHNLLSPCHFLTDNCGTAANTNTVCVDRGSGLNCYCPEGEGQAAFYARQTQ